MLKRHGVHGDRRVREGYRRPGLLAERWSSSSWEIQPIPAPDGGGGLLEAVACPAADACRAVGSDSKGLFSEMWNGSSWVIRPVPVPAGASFAGLAGVSCAAADVCEAVGSYKKRGTFRSLAEDWNGSHWLIQAPPSVSGTTSSQLDAVSCVSVTDCEAAGDAQTSASTQAGLLERWNGTQWSVQEKVLPAGDSSARLSGSRAPRVRSVRSPPGIQLPHPGHQRRRPAHPAPRQRLRQP